MREKFESNLPVWLRSVCHSWLNIIHAINEWESVLLPHCSEVPQIWSWILSGVAPHVNFYAFIYLAHEKSVRFQKEFKSIAPCCASLIIIRKISKIKNVRIKIKMRVKNILESTRFEPMTCCGDNFCSFWELDAKWSRLHLEEKLALFCCQKIGGGAGPMGVSPLNGLDGFFCK